jgi:micrococcal nuclease
MARSRAVRAVLAIALLGSAAWGWRMGARATATYNATVIRTIDGDTIDVRFDDRRTERVRILGADTATPRKLTRIKGRCAR